MYFTVNDVLNAQTKPRSVIFVMSMQSLINFVVSTEGGLEVRSVEPWGSQHLRDFQVKIISIVLLIHYLPFSLNWHLHLH